MGIHSLVMLDLPLTLSCTFTRAYHKTLSSLRRQGTCCWMAADPHLCCVRRVRMEAEGPWCCLLPLLEYPYAWCPPKYRLSLH